ncbi:MAG: hypothetical protein QF440_04460 [Candidatus Thalassarchaeaceae archaeon]|jgi:ssDNA-binding replication factor A large subunit|nr:hypothetical protein [Candidatus Thalassarchaeaceae archaeon]
MAVGMSAAQVRGDSRHSLVGPINGRLCRKNISNQSKSHIVTTVTSLKSRQRVDRIELVVFHKYPARTVKSRSWKGILSAASGRDQTGCVGLVLWGRQADSIQNGDTIVIENGWCRLYRGQKIVSTGRDGYLTVLNS